MTVVRDFEELYRTVEDPWNIGQADAPRYQRYCEMISPYVRGAVLDVGCGFGAFLARFKETSRSLDGVDISQTAIEKGTKRFPFIRFHHGSAGELRKVMGLQERLFDVIICSDVIYYLNDQERAELLNWIERHLDPSGRVFFAAWCPGGSYLTDHELRTLIESRFVVTKHEYFADSHHLALLARKRRKLVAITVDYETWHPIPAGKSIDWEVDIFRPTELLLELFGNRGVAATFFAEVGEYLWLRSNNPAVAQQMERQWRRIIERGHDVQLHLHPSWLPELGARKDEGSGSWWWDWSKAKADEYPGDLVALIARCKTALEAAIQPISPAYRVTTFRAGAYQAQPFGRLSEALIANGILADSSVYAFGVSEERGYDYSNAYSEHQPYFADLFDPQLKAIPAEERLVELPIFSNSSHGRWSIDGDGAKGFASRLSAHDERLCKAPSIRVGRLARRVRLLTGTLYAASKPVRRAINRVLPRRIAHWMVGGKTLRCAVDHYYVAIGHTKAALDLESLEASIEALQREVSPEFVTISTMVEIAKSGLEATARSSSEETAFQVEREMKAILGEERNFEQSDHLQQMIPLDSIQVLDFGCGAGYWSARISELYPWMKVVGIDAGSEFIAKARKRFSSSKVEFLQGDFASLPFAIGSFDCIYADNTLEHSFDLHAALSEINRVLRPGGCLVAAIPLDGLNPAFDCDNHTWKTVPSQIVSRLEMAGFAGIHFEIRDTYREFGMAPFPPSNDRMFYVRAWKGASAEGAVARAARAMDWIYGHVEPTHANLAIDAVAIIASGHAYCIGYAVALGQLLQREGFDVTWITMLADGHPRGHGNNAIESHQVIEVFHSGRRWVMDPMANSLFPCSIEEVLANPKLADQFANRDSRCVQRKYDLYNTSFWYERVARYARRRNPKRPVMYWTNNPHAKRRQDGK